MNGQTRRGGAKPTKVFGQLRVALLIPSQGLGALDESRQRFQATLHPEDTTRVNPARNKRRDAAPCSPREAKVNQYNPIVAVLHDVAGIYIPVAEPSRVEPPTNEPNVVLSIT